MTLPPRLARTATRTAAWAWQQLSPEARRATLTTASVLFDRPTMTLPRVQRVLVVAPHPDDETIGAGGTIARLTDIGTRVDVVCVTRGEATIGAPYAPAEVAVRRSDELRVACELLGAEAPTFLDLPDGRVDEAVDDLREALQGHADALAPELVLAPWALDRHPDHMAVADAVSGLGLPASCELWSYETHVPLPPTRVLDVSRTIERKRRALAAHETAALAFDLEATLGLSRWRSLLTNAGTGHAEAFLAVRWDEVVHLHERLCAYAGRRLGGQPQSAQSTPGSGSSDSSR